MKNEGNSSNNSNDGSGLPTSSSSTTATYNSNKRYKASLSTEIAGAIGSSNDSKEIMPANDADDVARNEIPVAGSIQSPSQPPKYGSKSYWDERYQKQFSLLAQTVQSTKIPSNGRQQQDDLFSDDNKSSSHRKADEDNIKNETNCNDTTTLPYHSWYFTYDELRPIILPLLLGERVCQDIVLQPPNDKSDVDDNETANNCSAENTVEEAAKLDDENEDGGDDDEGEEEDDEECDGDDREWEEVADDFKDGSDNDDDDEDEVPARDGLAKDGPVSVLEIGCGDVPLGAGLAIEFRNLTTTILQNSTIVTNEEDSIATNSNKLSLISKIVSTDYSPVVIDMMKRQYCIPEVGNESKKLKTPEENDMSTSDGSSCFDKQSLAPLEFEVVDARKLPYHDNTFHMVLEKGTLDAVLSDTEKGRTDCVQIVSECARVSRGCIVIVSHLNAQTPNGLGWLEEVVMEGLKKYSVGPTSDLVSWDIEVHGNAEVFDEEENETNNISIPTGTTGPAVYVIHKTMKHSEAQNSNSKEVSESIIQSQKVQRQSEDTTSISTDDDIVDIVPINVRFFSY